MSIYRFKTADNDEWQYICCTGISDLAVTLNNCDEHPLRIELLTDSCFLGEDVP